MDRVKVSQAEDKVAAASQIAAERAARAAQRARDKEEARRRNLEADAGSLMSSPNGSWREQTCASFRPSYRGLKARSRET